MRLLFAAGLMALAAACTPAAPAGPTAENVAAESKKLTQYLNDEFEEELAMNPMQLTQMGRKEHYGELGFVLHDQQLHRPTSWQAHVVTVRTVICTFPLRWMPLPTVGTCLRA